MRKSRLEPSERLLMASDFLSDLVRDADRVVFYTAQDNWLQPLTIQISPTSLASSVASLLAVLSDREDDPAAISAALLIADALGIER